MVTRLLRPFEPLTPTVNHPKLVPKQLLKYSKPNCTIAHLNPAVLILLLQNNFAKFIDSIHQTKGSRILRLATVPLHEGLR